MKKVERYVMSQDFTSSDTNITLEFVSEGKTTQYSPVLLTIYKIDTDVIYSTESKSGDLKHAYSMNNKALIDVELLQNLEPLAEIIDYVRF